MLVKELCTIVGYLYDVAENLGNFPLITFSSVNCNNDAISLYFTNKMNLSDNFNLSNQVNYSTQDELQYYYDCKRNVLVNTVDNQSSLIGSPEHIFETIVNNKDKEKICLILQEDLFKDIVLYIRSIIREALLNANCKNSKNINLFNAKVFQFFYDKIFENLEFYIKLSYCDKLQNLDNNYIISLGFSNVFTTEHLDNTKIDEVKRKIKNIEDQAREFFTNNLYITKFLFVDYTFNYKPSYDNDLWHRLYFVFHFPRLDQILFIKILESLFLYSELRCND